MEKKMYRWVVEIEVSSTWVGDGFDLTDIRANDMLARELGLADAATELRAKVLEAPPADEIAKEMGYPDDAARKLHHKRI